MGNPNDPTVNPNTDPNKSPLPIGGVQPPDQSPQVAPQTVQRQAAPSAAQAPQAGAQPVRRTSTLITNPKPPESDKPVEKVPSAVPQSTIEEMAAGQEALKRNAPNAAALEEVRRRAEAEKNDKSKA